MIDPSSKGADDSARASDTIVEDQPRLAARFDTDAYEPPPPPLAHGRGPAQYHPLTHRQRRFVDEYLVDCNASAAARRVGYSERAAPAAGGDLMRNPDVKAAIREAMDDRSYRLKLSADRVLLELVRIAFSDIGRIIDWSGDALIVEPPGRLSPDDRAAISEIAVVPSDGERGLAIKIKMHDKQRALALLARHLRVIGPHAIQRVESPSAEAERLRALILERHAKLVSGRDD